MKKIAFLVVGVLLVTQMSFIAFAHGAEGGHGQHETNAVRSLCNSAGYSKSEVHHYGGRYHYGNSMSNGRDNRALCNVEDCNLTSTHLHDGVYYHGHSVGDGHDYHVTCPEEGCAELTNHTHDADRHHSVGNGKHDTGHN